MTEPAETRGRTLQELVELLPGAQLVSAASGQLRVTGVSSSTNSVSAGDLFVGVPGARRHGAEFTAAAQRAGALAVLTDAAGVEYARPTGLPIIVVDAPRELLGKTAALVYGTEAGNPTLIGVTGTDGKTTTCYLLLALLDALHVRSGLSSTVEQRIGERSVSTERSGGLTTPESDYLHALVAEMRAEQVAVAALEVSAHALTRHRVDGFVFDSAIFTNLSQDHLDDYADMREYFAAKAELFTPERAHRGVISIDDDWGRELASIASVPVETVTTRTDLDADWQFTAEQVSLTRTDFTLTHRDGRTLNSSVSQPGWFVAFDAALAIVALTQTGTPLEQIAAALEATGGLQVTLPGRLDVVNPDGPGPRIYTDYGHTPGSMRTVLSSLRQLTPGKLFAVFGADGDRDTTKRPDMARAAAIADVVVITDYNPRFEDPATIRAALLDTLREEFPEHEVYEVADPAAGITKAVSIATENDVIFIGGNGHELAREVRGEHIPYSVKDAARAALREAGWQVPDPR